MWVNPTGLYRKLELLSKRTGTSMETFSKELFGHQTRIQEWRDGRIPSQARLRDVEILVERLTHDK